MSKQLPILVFTMAGKYQRFRLFGNKIPKYLLPLGTETILSVILGEYISAINSKNIYMIANKNDQIFYPIVKSILANYNISTTSIMYIDDTQTQLDTALHIRDLLPTEQFSIPISFVNIDTVIRSRNSFFDSLASCTPGHSLLDTFPARNPAYSYARINNDNTLADISDSHTISDTACSGLYGFSSLNHLINLATSPSLDSATMNFTSIYKKILSRGEKVYCFHNSLPNETIVLGTPEEYIINIHRF